MTLRTAALLLALSSACGQVKNDTADTSDRDGTGARGSGDSGAGATGSGEGGAGAGGAMSGGRFGSSASGGEAGSGGSESTGGRAAVVEEEGTRAMRAGPTVWIGEVELHVTYPGLVLKEGPQKVVLILDRVESGVAGTVTFGSALPLPAPKTATEVYPPETTYTEDGEEYPIQSINWSALPYDGFPYSIVSSELRGNNLVLAFVPYELFDAWCRLQDVKSSSVCTCDNGACRGNDGPTRRLELVVSGASTLTGQLARQAAPHHADIAALKLTRVR